MESTGEDAQEHHGPTREEKRPVQLASHGVGPLYQRDYVVVIEGSCCTAEDVAMRLRTGFPSFSPEHLAWFRRPDDATDPLVVGDTMHVFIQGAGHCGVRVVHVDERSLTLRTQGGHIEAGRITFGAYHDEVDRLVCRIRSRARIADPVRLLGYVLLGKLAQTRIWIGFLERLAAACGGKLLDHVLVATDTVAESPADRGEEDAPTFDAGCGAEPRCEAGSMPHAGDEL
jgi:hypothetical protein